MYAGTTFRKSSGKFIGVHQRIDRLARRGLKNLPGVGPGFPIIEQILHFEGNNGPDGVKRKSPSRDEPWHYIDPTSLTDRTLIDLVLDHYSNLVQALKHGDQIRAAFEASWLAHAVTDGLTPAHHYPLSDKIEQLWGKPKEERLTILDKNFIRGATLRDTLGKNWQYWGAKGVFLTHFAFELGIASSIRAYKFKPPTANSTWMKQNQNSSIEKIFTDAASEVYQLNMYEYFWKNGWNSRLARITREKLIPTIVRTVTYVWYRAYLEAEL